MALEAHVGDTGTVLRYTIKDGDTVVDLSLATSMTLVIRSKDRSISTITGTLFTDGTDGVVDFVSLVGTWTVSGASTEQVQLVLPSGSWSAAAVSRIIGAKLA